MHLHPEHSEKHFMLALTKSERIRSRKMNRSGAGVSEL